MSKEQELIDAVASILDNETDAEGRVYPMRYKYADLSDLPMICIYDASMDSTNLPDSQSEERRANLSIMLFVYGPQSPAVRDDAADTKMMILREQVEALLGKAMDDLGVDGIADKEYQGYSIIDDKQNKDAENLVLTCSMRYQFKYYNVLANL